MVNYRNVAIVTTHQHLFDFLDGAMHKILLLVCALVAFDSIRAAITTDAARTCELISHNNFGSHWNFWLFIYHIRLYR